jgi:SARP family transcriptional regulator, regulator of embCAB operon
MHARHIRALCRMGRYAEAVEAYKNAARVLSDELGIGPGSELRSVTEDLATFDSGLPAPAPGGADRGGPPYAGRPIRATHRVRLPRPRPFPSDSIA